MNRYIEVEKFDNRYEVKALQDCGIQWTVDGCTHYTAVALLRADEVYLNLSLDEGVTFRAVGPDGQPLETVHGSWRSWEEVHARHLAEAKAQLVTVRAEHRTLLESASGLRRAILESHSPDEGVRSPRCRDCSGAAYEEVDFPCTTYTLARDWVDESNERYDRAETTRRDAENEAAQLRAELAAVRHERDLLKEERW